MNHNVTIVININCQQLLINNHNLIPYMNSVTSYLVTYCKTGVMFWMSMPLKHALLLQDHRCHTNKYLAIASKKLFGCLMQAFLQTTCIMTYASQIPVFCGCHTIFIVC